MRVTLDLTPALLRSAGVRNHLHYWASALQASRNQHQVSLFPYLSSIPPLVHNRGIETGVPNWRLFLVFAFNHPATHEVAKRLIPRPDVFHGSPQLRRRPSTGRLTSHIHDLTCWLMPELHTDANVRAARETAENVWKYADGLIAVSNSARDDAVRLLGLDARRITVIYHGVPEQFFTVNAAELARVRNLWGLQRPYVLNVGTLEPRKNILNLLNAWAALPSDVRNEFELVVAGPPGWKAKGILDKLTNAGAGIRYLGYVPEADLPGLTAGAAANAYPSLYEGFGFPLAQAMACGVPSVTSNVSSMPEIAADSALLIDPRSEAELRGALLRLLTSAELRRELGEQGRQHAQTHYRWDEAARHSWEFFDRVAGL